MDFYMNKINAYYNVDNLPFYTDTDSIIVHKNCVDILKEYFKPSTLGYLDFDISGNIIEYYSLCPKVYCC